MPFARSWYRLLCVLAVALSASAQQDLEGSRKNRMYIGGGAAVPGNVSGQTMSAAGLMQIGYGYRLAKYLEAGAQVVGMTGSAGINRSQAGPNGEVAIGDEEVLVPFGGRAILPVGTGRFELFGGGGGAYLHYAGVSESKFQQCPGPPPFYVTLCEIQQPCAGCTSRGGWGYYGNAGTNLVLDRRRRFFLAIEIQLLRGKTVGNFPGTSGTFEIKDRWINTAVNVGYRF